MTEIKSAIEEFQEWIDRAEEFNPDVESDHVKAMKLAIRSLQAWEEVLQELKNMREIIWQDTDDEGANAWDKIQILNKVIDIINQKLAEIEERN